MKKTKLTRLLSIVMAVCLVIGLLPATALAVDEEPSSTSVTSAEELVAAIAAGGTVTLGADITLSKVLEIPESTTVTLNLGGYTLTQPGTTTQVDEDGDEYDGGINAINNYGELTISGTGSIVATNNGIYNAGTLTVDGATVNGDFNSIYNVGTATIKSGTFTGEGAVWNEGDLTIEDGTFTSLFEAVGLYQGDNDSISLTIYGGTFDSTLDEDPNAGGWFAIWADPGIEVSTSITITGGTFNDPLSLEIGNVENCTLNISGGTFNSSALYAAVNVDNFDVTISDGTFIATDDEAAFEFGTTGDSNCTISGGTFTAANGVAVVIDGSAGEYSITGGTFSTENGNAVQISSGSNDGSYSITGGDFTGAVNVISLPKDQSGLISGGTFDSDVSDYVVEGSSYDSTTGVVTPAPTGVAQIGETTYATLAEAINNVGESETITILCDIPDAVGISVPSGKNFTIDFGGHTYTVSDPGAGSTGTQTNAFQLLKDSTITFKNGTVRIAEGATSIKRIIQNYANLTLEDMSFYAENQADGEDYALSFNYGNIVFKGNTSVYTTEDDTIAFDVYFWNTPSYIDGVSVTFDESYTGTVNGVILYDSTDADKAELTIAGNGTFGTVTVSSTSCAEPNISISGGTFSSEVPLEYCAEGYIPLDNEDGTYGVKEGAYVASITTESGTAYYETLADAIDAAKTGDTVTLLTDVTASGINIEKSIILDLNTYKITYKPSTPLKYYVIWADEGANITLKNGTIYSAYYTVSTGDYFKNYPILVNNATVTLDNMSVTGGYYPVRTNNANSVVNINNSTITASTQIPTVGILNIAGTVTVNEGSTVSSSNGIFTQLGGNTIVSGGVVSGINFGLAVIGSSGYETSATISGGEVKSTAPDGSAVYVSGNYSYTDGKVGDEDTREAYSAIVNISGGYVHSARTESQVDGKDVSDSAVYILGKGAELNISGTAKVEADCFAVAGNGTHQATSYDDSGTKITISGGTLVSTKGLAIYHPQYGELTITGGTITGVTGIEMRAGELNVSGNAEITATAEAFEAKANGSGSTVQGAGIAVSQHTTNLPITVNISGTADAAPTISGYYALYEVDLQDAVTENVTLNISGGSFTATGSDAAAVFSANVTGFVSGGTFSSQVLADYCALGYEPTTIADENGMFTVQVREGVEAVIVGTTSAGTLSDMLAAAANGQTVQLLANVENASIVIVKSGITLDLNGKELNASNGAALFGGKIKDSSSGDAIVVVPNSWLSFTSFDQLDGQIALYDTRNPEKTGYRFFDFTIGTYVKGIDVDSGKFQAWINFGTNGDKNVVAGEILATGNSGLGMQYTLNWTTAKGDECERSFKFTVDSIQQYGNMIDGAFTLTVTGVENQSAVSATPEFTYGANLTVSGNELTLKQAGGNN